MDNKYKRGKIYKLVCDATPIVYYGSTIQTLARRFIQHKNLKDCASKELFDKGNVSIELIEEYPCNNKAELESRERFYIEFMLKNFTHRIICNKLIPTRTRKEHREANKNQIAERDRLYYQANLEKISKRKKIYREANREKISEKGKEYYKLNKETIKEKKNEKFDCECGGRYLKSNKAIHFKTKKHLEYINSHNHNTYNRSIQIQAKKHH